MQVLIAFISTFGSILGIVGLFSSTPLFLIGGTISFFGLLVYGETFIRNRDRLAREQEATKVANKDEKELAFKKSKRIQTVSRVITAIIFTAIFLIFKLYGISWIGILFGLMFIPELFGRIIKKAVNQG